MAIVDVNVWQRIGRDVILCRQSIFFIVLIESYDHPFQIVTFSKPSGVSLL